MSVKGQISLELRITDKIMKGDFTVAEMGFQLDILLGRDFISKHDFTIHTKPWEVYLEGKKINISLCDEEKEEREALANVELEEKEEGSAGVEGGRAGGGGGGEEEEGGYDPRSDSQARDLRIFLLRTTIATVSEREKVELTDEDRLPKLSKIVDEKFTPGTKENIALRRIISEYPKALSLKEEPLTVSDKFEHEIRTRKVVYTRPYNIPIKYQSEINKQIEGLLERGMAVY